MEQCPGAAAGSGRGGDAASGIPALRAHAAVDLAAARREPALLARGDHRLHAQAPLQLRPSGSQFAQPDLHRPRTGEAPARHDVQRAASHGETDHVARRDALGAERGRRAPGRALERGVVDRAGGLDDGGGRRIALGVAREDVGGVGCSHCRNAKVSNPG